MSEIDRTASILRKAEVRSLSASASADDPLQRYEAEQVVMPAISVREASESQNSDISEFYARCGYSGGHSPSDTVLIAIRAESLVGGCTAVRRTSGHCPKGNASTPEFSATGNRSGLTRKVFVHSRRCCLLLYSVVPSGAVLQRGRLQALRRNGCS